MSEGQNKRVVEFSDVVDADSAGRLSRDLFALDQADHETPIELHIESPGGVVTDALGVVNVINTIQAPVHTLCNTFCAGSAALIYASGEQGHRTATPGALFVFPDVGITGGGIKVGIFGKLLEHAEMDLRQAAQDAVTAVFAAATGHSEQEAADLFGGGKAYSADQARQAGLVDQVKPGLF